MKHKVAKWLMTAGVILVIGSIGACENEDCSLLQCAVCVTCGAVLGLAGYRKTGGESGIEED